MYGSGEVQNTTCKRERKQMRKHNTLTKTVVMLEDELDRPKRVAVATVVMSSEMPFVFDKCNKLIFFFF